MWCRRRRQVFRDEAYLPLHCGQTPHAAQLAVLQAASIGQLQQSRADYFRFIEALLGTPIGGRLRLPAIPSGHNFANASSAFST
jgi:hypothetical protein